MEADVSPHVWSLDEIIDPLGMIGDPVDVIAVAILLAGFSVPFVVIYIRGRIYRRKSDVLRQASLDELREDK